MATKGPCQLSRPQPTALPAPTGCLRKKHLLGARGWAPPANTWGGGGAPTAAPGVGEGRLLPRARPQAVTHRRGPADRGEQPGAGPGRRGRQVRQVCSAPPRPQSAQSLGELAPSSRQHSPPSFRRGPARPRPRVPGRPAGSRRPAPSTRLPASPQPASRPSRRRARSMARPQVLAFGLLFAAATLAVAVAHKRKEQSCGLGPGGGVPRHPRRRWW